MVDEAHLVAKWGKGFRRLYAFTSTARHFWEGSLVCVLSNLRRPNIEDSYSRSWDVTIQRNSINRPELVYQIVFIPNKAGSTFVLFSTSMGTRRCPQKQVPKTIVFFDTKKEAIAARDCCCLWLRRNCQPEWGTSHQYTEKEMKTTI